MQIEIENKKAIENKNNNEKAKENENSNTLITNDLISFSEFKKIVFKVATIKAVEEIPGAEKLVKLIIDLGNEERQLVAGIKKFYSIDELVGKQIIVVANLQPAKLKGIESQGMLLAAIEIDEGQEKIALLMPDKKIKEGSLVG